MNRGGRPRRQIDIPELLRLRQEGSSWRAISRKMGLGKATVCRAYQAATDAPRVSQNPLANETREAVSVSAPDSIEPRLALKIRLCLLRVRLERERLQRFLLRARVKRAREKARRTGSMTSSVRYALVSSTAASKASNCSRGPQHLHNGVERIGVLDLLLQFCSFHLLGQDVIISINSGQEGVPHRLSRGFQYRTDANLDCDSGIADRVGPMSSRDSGGTEAQCFAPARLVPSGRRVELDAGCTCGLPTFSTPSTAPQMGRTAPIRRQRRSAQEKQSHPVPSAHRF